MSYRFALHYIAAFGVVVIATAILAGMGVFEKSSTPVVPVITSFVPAEMEENAAPANETAVDGDETITGVTGANVTNATKPS